MSQGYIDNETSRAFMAFFEGQGKDELAEQMESAKEKLAGSSTLVAETTGETLKEARAKLQAEMKKSLYEKA